MRAYRNTKEFLEGRDAALLSGDVEQLREHLIRAETPGAKDASKKVLEISLHKCRIHWRHCPPELLKESVWWLLDRDLSLMLYTGSAYAGVRRTQTGDVPWADGEDGGTAGE